MPLRDHFAKKVRKGFRWEGFHSQWASTIVRQLNRGVLPARYRAEPRVRLGTANLSQEDVFEVRVYDDDLEAKLVAAIELVSPSNKDRPLSRNDFVVKCASMLKAHVAIVVIDIITNLRANLFEELVEYLEIQSLENPLAGKILYACSLLPRGANGHAKVKVWPAVLQVGNSLPTLPLWLRDDFAVPLELETTYEETCRDLGA